MGYVIFVTGKVIQSYRVNILAKNVSAKYGDSVKINVMPGFTFYLIANPASIEHIFQPHQLKYCKPDRFNHAFGVIAGNGLVTSEGSFWMRQRRLMQPGFLKEAMVSLTEMMSKNIQWFLEEWDATPVVQ